MLVNTSSSRFSKLVALFGSAVIAATGLAVLPHTQAAVAAGSSKLVVIPFENQSYDDIVGSTQAPYLNRLMSQGTVFTHYQAVADGSNPNYLAMTSGLTTALTPPSPNVFQAIDATTGVSWKGLMESMTGTCGGGTSGSVPGSTDPLYTSDHDPAASGYSSNTTCSTNDIPLTTSSFNPANLPNFTYLVPNECDDMHTPVPAGQTCPAFFGRNPGTSLINMGDNWLATVVPQLLAQPNITVLITWDEWNSETGTALWEHVVTLEVGAGVTAGGLDNNSYDHYSLEAGLYRYLGLGIAPNNGANALPLPIPAAGAPPYPGTSNPITKENSNPGTTAWELIKNADDTNLQIAGYASATSVNLGDSLNFYVTVNPAQKFTMDFYRFGYYQGLGGRFLLEIPNLTGVTQPSCPMDGTTGMIACNWANSYTFTVPTTWVSGVYLVKLTSASGWQSYVIFVVRNDTYNSALLYQVPFNTYQAYNNWPADIPAGGTVPRTGKDLYDQDSSATLTSLGTQRAVEVSYDRPYAENNGSGAFLNYEANDVAWLEQQGYDVSYASSIDVDLRPNLFLNHHGFISAGHDEYWSMTMFNNLSQIRDSGVNVAFLGADSVSWQIRYAPDAAGLADHQIICYKSATLDPVQDNTITVHFFDPQVNMPEQSLVGAVHGGQQMGSSSATPAPFVVQNSSNWVYTNTGASDGQTISDVVGYEIQTYSSVFPSPTSVPGTYQMLSNSPIVNSNNVTVNQNATIYQSGSGAWVFNAASIEWGWALFDFGFSLGGEDHPDYASPFVQIMTANVLNKFSAGTLPLPAAPTNLNAVPSATSVSLTWTDNDATATYELDRSTDPAFRSFTAVRFPAGATSYTDTGLGTAVYYYRLFAIGVNGESPYVDVNASTVAYTSLVAARSSLLGHWRLGESSGTTAFDTTGSYNGTYVNSPVLGSPGAINNDPNTSVTFNGSTQRVTLPSLPTVGDFSIEGWTYLTNPNVNNNALYSSSTSVQVLARPGTGGFPTSAYVAVIINGTTYVLQPNSPGSNINTWTHWVVTRQGSTLNLYRNGVNIAQRTDLPATATVALNGYIASQNNGAYYLTGRVQDVAIYNQALSGDDVENDYVAGLNAVAPPPPPIYPLTPTNFRAVPSASTVSLSWTDSDATSSYRLYRGTDPGFSNAVSITLPAGTAGYTDTGLGQGVFFYKLVALNTGGQSPPALASAATTSYSALVNGRPGMLAHWRLSEGSGTTAWDTTGAYNGVYVNSPTLGSPGAIATDPATSTTFNGSNQRVVPPALPTIQDFSIEGWTYLTNSSVNNNTVYGSGTMQLLARPGTGSFPSAAYAAVTLNGTTYILQPNSPASNINTWVYWVMSRQGSTLTLYRNGVQIGQLTNLPATATTSLSGYIADESTGSYYLTGRLQDVAVYNRALSGAEVSSGYTAAVNGLAPTASPASSTPYYNTVRSEPSVIAYWRLGESSGTTANDELGHYSGTYVNGPALGSAGAIVNDPDKSVTFNGTSQRVSLPSLPSAGDFSIEGWTYLTNSSVNNNTVYGSGSMQLLARPGTGSFLTAAYAGVTLNGTLYVLQPNSPASNINTWVYWVMTRQGGTLSLYRNGVLIGQRTDLPATATTSLSGWIAEQSSGATYYLAGGIDDVALYNSALTPQDITSHYQAALSGPAPAPHAAPSVAVTSPTNGALYGGNWTGSINGTAISNSGFTLATSVSVQDTTTGRWWGGSAFDQAGQTFVPVTSGTTTWTLAFAATNLTSGHGYVVTAQATDLVGNVGTSLPVGFSYNTTPPIASVSYPTNGGTYGANWTGSITGSAAGSSSPVAGVAVAIEDTTTTQWWGGSAFNQSGPTFVSVTSGTTSWSLAFPAANLTSGHGYAVTAQATDGAGNVGTSTSVAFSYTTNAPTTSIACNGGACANWYNAPVSVTLSATEPGGPGVSATYYTTDGSTPTTSSTVYAGAFTVSSTRPVKFFSVDTAGNAESVRTQQIQIDAVAPTTAIACNGAPCSSSSYRGPVTVTLSAADNAGGSGVLATFYTTDGSSPTTSGILYAGAFTVSTTSTIKFYSVDNAGNAEAIKSQAVQVVTLVSIAVTPVNPSIAKGSTQQFTAVATYSDSSTQDVTSSASWTSSNTTVATISAGGLATGIAQGTSQVGATIGSVSGSTSLTVGPAQLVSIAVTPANPSIGKGTTQQFAATGTYSDGSTVDLTGVANWASSNTAAATITSAGLATGVGQGSSQISATIGSVTGSTTLTVSPAVVVSVAVTPLNPSIASGTSQQFAAVATYSDGSTQDVTGSAAWASSNTTVATITSGGLATGGAQGTSQISATSSGVSGGTTLAVGPPVLVSIAVTPANPTIAKGAAQQFAATGTFSDGSTTDLTGVATWLSANTSVATITGTGLATGAAAGTSQISATSAGVSGSTTLTVSAAAVVSISVTPASPTIAKGMTQQFTAVATYSDGSTQDVTGSAAWASSNTTAASITAGGLATGVAPGTSQISASSGSVTGNTTLTVGPAVLVSIAVTPSNPSIAKGATQQFTATGAYSDGSNQDLTSSVAWASSNTTVATITSAGLATGIAQGTSQVSATVGALTSSTTVTVGPAVLASITVRPANPSIAQGKTQQFTASGTYTDGTSLDVTGAVTWVSSNTGVATIAAGGLATGVAQGTSQISAGSGSISGSTTLNVGPTVLVSIAVTPANPTIAKGTTQQFTATGTYSDASTQNLTSLVSWASSNTGVASVTASGLATGVAQGTSQITASWVGVTGGTTLTVGPARLLSIAVTPLSSSMAKGQTKQFNATGTYSDGSTLDLTGTARWTSSNTGVATITATGLATGVGKGNTQISAALAGVTTKTGLGVTAAVLASIAVTPANPSIAQGRTQQFAATGTYSDGTTKNLTTSATWASSNTAVATITSGGLATGVASSTSEISATLGGITGSTTLTVGTATLVSIAVSPANPTIAKGTKSQFTATGTYSDGSTQDLTHSATWSSSNTAAATVTAGGLATGVAQGTAQVGATTAGVTGSTTLTVGSAVLVSIAVTPANPSIVKGNTRQFHATGTYSDGSTLDLTSSATWGSSNTAVAIIDGSGLASGVGQGTSQISAGSAGVTGSTTLTVGAATLVSIAITPANQSVKVGTSVQYVATGTYSDGTTQNLTSSVTWTSSNTGVATIASGGATTTLAAGTATITAALGGVNGTTSLSVTTN